MDTPTPFPSAPMPGTPGQSGQTFKIPEVSSGGSSSGKKIAMFLIVALVIAGGGFGGYYFYFLKNAETEPLPTVSVTPRQTPVQATPADPYSGWQTYLNTVYTYEIRFPSGWSIDSAKSEQPFSSRAGTMIGGDTKFIGPGSSYISLLIFKKNPTAALSSYDAIYASGGTKVNKATDITMASGSAGRQYELEIGRSTPAQKVVRTIFASGENLYSFQSDISLISIHTQILSTFKMGK